MIPGNDSRVRFFRSRSSLILTAMAVAVAAFGVYRALPTSLFPDPYSTVILARDGRLLGARIADDGQWRFPESRNCPSRYARAVLSYEDKRFRHHPGIDPLAVARAVIQNIKAHRKASGASTLSMQVIRLSRKGRPRIWIEKIWEAFLAVRLECSYSKDEILALYASHAPFGGNVVGLSAAAWRYFGRDPESLSWSEAALLAVLPNSPSLMHPGRNREVLLQKRNRLLDRLWSQGHIDSLTCMLAHLEPLPDKPVDLPKQAPHLLGRMASEMDANGNDVRSAAIRRTTLDADLQEKVGEVLERRGRELEGKDIHNGAVLVLHVPTGHVLAYVGNISEESSGDGREVDIITSRRSTGSLLKPFLFAAMLDAGELLPTTLVPDIPSQMGGYAPQNFDRGYEGAVPAQMALARSLNVPAVRMLKDYGTERFLHLLHDLGMTTLNRSATDYGLTLVLGGAEGTLWDLSGMYAGLAREALGYADASSDPSVKGAFFAPQYLNAGDSRTGGASAPHSPAIGPAAAWFTLQAMAEVSRPDAEKYWRSFASSRWVAWKTGTSFGFRDAWAVGVTPEYMVGVWIGNASGQGRPGMTGIQVAAPVLFEVFNLLPPTSHFPMPVASMTRIPICRQSGMRPSAYCPFVDSVWVPLAGVRTMACPYHRLIHLDATGSWQVHDGCESVAKMRHVPWFVLPPSQEWYYRQRHSDYLPALPWRKDCAEGAAALGNSKSMDLIYPRGKAVIYVPVDLDARKSRTVFEAVHRDPAATIFWYLDRDYLGMTHEFHKIELDPAPGVHTLLLVDNRGERLEHVFEVMARDDATGKK